MRSLSRRGAIALACVCTMFALFIATVGIVGVLGVTAATQAGKRVTDDELVTVTTTAQLGLMMDAAYATGENALRTANATQQSSLAAALYSDLVPQVDEGLDDIQGLHANDPPAERNEIDLLAAQWSKVRDLLSPLLATGAPQPALADRLSAAYQPLADHIGRLITAERVDADSREEQAASNSRTTTWLIVGGVALGVMAAIGLGWEGRRRVRRAFEPQQHQAEFADMLQIAGDEDEAHLLLQRHLERTLPHTEAVVLNRNNSADRLEAMTPLPSGSPLEASLVGAEPRSCLAVRSGRPHTESSDHPGLLACAVCVVCPGNSRCTPLTVSGEVIGSVLLNRTAPYSEAEDQAIRESVSQSAPVLANLRNLAIAEMRAATDGLTGLPNKRAVTDSLKRLFAQASRTGTGLSLVLLDLDHFKQINDQHGHPVGDQVLASVGAALRGVLRVGDFAGRNGGEEFALILPGAPVSVGYDVAQRVRAAIADITIPGSPVTVTASLGVASYPDHASTLERLERVADAALYVAKRSGRNRAEIADPTHDPVVETELTAIHGDRAAVAIERTLT
jgi:diguanylate cyclase (GGDEF)-like protein